MTAHMFWTGDLTEYEIASMKSYVANGFDVVLWSYDSHKLPSGVTPGDASEVIDRKFLEGYTQQYWGDDHYSEEPKRRAALFSDMFRYLVLFNHGGWWVDLDTVCLRPATEFDELYRSNEICVAYENEDKSINCAVIAIPNKDIARAINGEIWNRVSKKSEFEWGGLGPRVVSQVVDDLKLNGLVFDISTFYPNSTPRAVGAMWRPINSLRPEAVEKMRDAMASSYTMHWFNNIHHGDDKSKVTSDTFIGQILEQYLKDERQ